jgi:hypothetical protein
MDENHPEQTRRRSGFLIAVFTGLLAVGLTVNAALASDNSVLQQAATPTGGGGQLQLPTATQTVVGGPTSTPTRTPTLAPVFAEVIGDPTNLRSLPTIGDEYVIESLSPGITLPIIGRWLGYDWLLVAWEDGEDGQAWVYEPLVVIRGDITTVPSVEPPPPPTVNPTQAAAQATETILLQTPGAIEAATGTAAFAPTGIFTQTPGAGEQSAAGVLPTFTPGQAYVQPEALPNSGNSGDGKSLIPPAVLIVSLASMGILALALGLLRRVF